LEFGRRYIPVRPTFLGNYAQVLAQIFHRRSAEEPVTHVDLVYNEAGLENDRVRDHRIVDRIGVFGDIEIFLDLARRVGEERPMGTDSHTKFVRLGNVIGTDRDQPAIANFHLAMELNEPFMLPAIPRAETSAAEYEYHWIFLLQLGEFPAFTSVVGKL